MENLELRMYFFVNYQLTGIQKGIQAGHAALEYAHYYRDSRRYQEFRENHKTWIVLNGGTTNKNPENLGTMDDILFKIQDYNKDNQNPVRYAYFNEPDLNDALTAICFICDQRVWDRELAPEWEDYRDDYYRESDGHIDKDIDLLYLEWVELIGSKNIFFRELIRGKRKA